MVRCFGLMVIWNCWVLLLMGRIFVILGMVRMCCFKICLVVFFSFMFECFLEWSVMKRILFMIDDVGVIDGVGRLGGKVVWVSCSCLVIIWWVR